jgi:hypothetical protein
VFLVPGIVLEEYYHVLKQWNTGRVTGVAWVAEFLKKGYDDNRFVIEAKAFVKEKVDDFISCLKCPKNFEGKGTVSPGGVLPQ